jgi:hypothetical protein
MQRGIYNCEREKKPLGSASAFIPYSCLAAFQQPRSISKEIACKKSYIRRHIAVTENLLLLLLLQRRRRMRIRAGDSEVAWVALGGRGVDAVWLALGAGALYTRCTHVQNDASSSTGSESPPSGAYTASIPAQLPVYLSKHMGRLAGSPPKALSS